MPPVTGIYACHLGQPVNCESQCPPNSSPALSQDGSHGKRRDRSVFLSQKKPTIWHDFVPFKIEYLLQGTKVLSACEGQLLIY